MSTKLKNNSNLRSLVNFKRENVKEKVFSKTLACCKAKE